MWYIFLLLRSFHLISYMATHSQPSWQNSSWLSGRKSSMYYDFHSLYSHQKWISPSKTVYFANEFKWFIGYWKIASWNLFLNILLYKLSSHIWCFPGKHSKTGICESVEGMKRGRGREQLLVMLGGTHTPVRDGLKPTCIGSWTWKSMRTESVNSREERRKDPPSPPSLPPLHS